VGAGEEAKESDPAEEERRRIQIKRPPAFKAPSLTLLVASRTHIRSSWLWRNHILLGSFPLVRSTSVGAQRVANCTFRGGRPLVCERESALAVRPGGRVPHSRRRKMSWVHRRRVSFSPGGSNAPFFENLSRTDLPNFADISLARGATVGERGDGVAIGIRGCGRGWSWSLLCSLARISSPRYTHRKRRVEERSQGAKFMRLFW